MVGARDDPFLGFNFLVEIRGLVVAGFSEVTGLQAEIEVKDFREGGVNEYIHKLAGPTRYPSNLVLKRGLTYVDEMWSWYEEVTSGVILRKNGFIVLLGSAGEYERCWEFSEAYPVKWIGPELRAATAQVAVETLELVHRGLTKSF